MSVSVNKHGYKEKCNFQNIMFPNINYKNTSSVRNTVSLFAKVCMMFIHLAVRSIACRVACSACLFSMQRVRLGECGVCSWAQQCIRY